MAPGLAGLAGCGSTPGIVRAWDTWSQNRTAGAVRKLHTRRIAISETIKQERMGVMRSGNLLLFAVIAVAGACATVPVFEPREWGATVESRSGSDVRANVRAATAPGQTAVSINLAGGQSGGTHPWHIHTGTCANSGGIVGAASAYPPLQPGSNGAASAIAHVAVQLVPGENYHVNVHRSPQALGEIVGCGDLR